MKNTISLVSFLAGAGMFFSGFVFWMAHTSHNEAVFIQENGTYREVSVVNKHMSRTRFGTGKHRSTHTHYYLDIVPSGSKSEQTDAIRCSVLQDTYYELDKGAELNAWILGEDACLDIGLKNARAVSRRMLVVCIACGITFFTNVIRNKMKTKRDTLSASDFESLGN